MKTMTNGVMRHIASIAFACAFADPIRATTIHVPADHPTIQAAINAAANGDTILVAPGAYNEAIIFNGKALTLESSGGRDATIINAAGTDTSAVKIIDTQGAGSTVIDGFTITVSPSSTPGASAMSASQMSTATTQ